MHERAPLEKRPAAWAPLDHHNTPHQSSTAGVEAFIEPPAGTNSRVSAKMVSNPKNDPRSAQRAQGSVKAIGNHYALPLQSVH